MEKEKEREKRIIQMSMIDPFSLYYHISLCLLPLLLLLCPF
jgi:hypothetical protein